MSRLSEDMLSEEGVVDRCLVCESTRPDRDRQRVKVALGGVSGEAIFDIEFCADSPDCGEEAALALIESMSAVFVVIALRRRHSIALLDLGIPL